MAGYFEHDNKPFELHKSGEFLDPLSGPDILKSFICFIVTTIASFQYKLCEKILSCLKNEALK